MCVIANLDQATVILWLVREWVAVYFNIGIIVVCMRITDQHIYVQFA